MFQSVLSPEEHLLWTGQPRKDNPIFAGLTYVILVIFVGKSVQLLWSIRPDPMPVLLQLELLLLAVMFAMGGSYLGFLIPRTWITAYAVTNRRLLMAVGWRRDKIRNVALADLAMIKIVSRPRAGKMLFFYKIDLMPNSGPLQVSPRVWMFLESGQADTWKSPWTPSKAESVRQLIKTAKANNKVQGKDFRCVAVRR